MKHTDDRQRANVTTQDIEPGDTTECLPEFGRPDDVRRLFGIKRGTLYNLLNSRKVRGLVLRVTGSKSGIRLIHLASVRDYILSQMQEAI